MDVVREMPLAVGALTLAIMADDLSTAISLGHGDVVEVNPVSLVLLSLGAGWLYGLKLAAVPVVVGLVSAFEPAERRCLRRIVLAAAIILIGIALHNLVVG